MRTGRSDPTKPAFTRLPAATPTSKVAGGLQRMVSGMKDLRQSKPPCAKPCPPGVRFRSVARASRQFQSETLPDLGYILAVRTIVRRTGAARDVAAHFAVTGRWNWPDQGNNLEAGHRAHEPGEYPCVADVAGRGVLSGRCHQAFLPAAAAITSRVLRANHWPRTARRPPIPRHFPENAVRESHGEALKLPKRSLSMPFRPKEASGAATSSA